MIRTLGPCALLLAALSAGCSSDSDQPPAPRPPSSAPAPIRFGLTISLTGDLKGLGQPGQNAARVAEAQINSLGGVLNRPLSLTVEDDQTQDQGAIDAVTKLLGQGVSAVIGPTNSTQAIKTNQLTAAQRVLMISATASSPTLSGCPQGQTEGCSQPLRDRYFFRTTASHTLQGKTIAIFASQGPSPDRTCKKMALIHNDDSYGNPIASQVITQFTALGGEAVLDVKIPPTVKASYKEEARQVIDIRPDCQLLIMFPPAGIQYLKDFKNELAQEQGDWSKFFTIGSNGIKIDSFLVDGRQNPADPTSPTIGEGIYLTIADTSPPTSEYQAFKNLYTQHFPQENPAAALPTYVANFYDAVILASLAIQLAGTTDDPVRVRDSLYTVSKGLSPSAVAYGPDQLSDLMTALKAGRDVNYKGASGPVDIDDAGDVLNDFVVWHIENGAFVQFSRVSVTQLGN